jgi:DNA-nicking Smr family endonuclease
MARKRKHHAEVSRQQIVPDFELWTEVTRSIVPLKPQPDDSTTSQANQMADLLADVSPPKRTDTAVGKILAPADRPAPQHKAAPALTGLDRRTSQRLTRGKLHIDERIDLHGDSAGTAHVRLRGFLTQAQAHGARTVLVITGKGSSQFTRHTLHGSDHFHAPERQGRLRRLVTQWFNEPEFARLISGFQPAHPKHGGGGAFYVRLRRARRPEKPR